MCIFRDLQAQLPLSAEPIVRMHVLPAQGKFQSKLDNLSVVSSIFLAVWCFLNVNRKLPHCCQFSRIHLWAAPCRALKVFTGERGFSLLAESKLCMVQEMISLYAFSQL